MADGIRTLLRAEAEVAESPVWDEATNALFWVDVPRGELHRVTSSGIDEVVIRCRDPLGSIALRHGGGFVLATGMRIVVLNHDLSVRMAVQVHSGDRMNDGKCDAAGRFLVGTMCYDRSPRGALYRLNVDGSVDELLTGIAVSNGLDWSPDGKSFYYVDSPTRRIDVMAYDADTGNIGPRRTLVELDGIPGNPDGLTVDANGGIWVVMHRGGQVCRFTPLGELDRAIPLPVARPTSCTFGGASLRSLYVTNAGPLADGSQAESLAGSLFELRPGVAGKPGHRFRDDTDF